MIGLARIGGPVACFGLALLLVSTTRRDRLAGLGFAFIGACVIGSAVSPDKPLEVAGGFVAGLLLAAVLAVAFHRIPWLLPIVALAFVPVRVGIHVGDSGSKLLLPLYVVAGGAALAMAWEIANGDTRSRELRLAAKPLAAFVLWTGLSIAWTKDVHQGAIELLGFYIPFTVLAVAIARLPWSELGVKLLYLEVTVMALVFAVVGFYQYETRNVFENPKVIYSNAYAPFFRVNSVFWDPSIYGRFLAVAMVPSILLAVRARSPRVQWSAAAVVAVVWLGLLISFSQSSFAALLVAVLGIAAVAWRWRALLAVGLAVLVLVGLAAAQPQVRRSLQHHTTSGLNSATSGRASLVANGIRIAEAHPALGVGVGGFRRAYADRMHLKGKEPKKAASHNTPVTVAAETGLPGLALFAWLCVSLFVLAFRRFGRGESRDRVSLVAGLALAGVFVHSLFYNDFVEDPTTWMLIGLVALAVGGSARRSPVEPVRETREPVPA